MRKKIDPLFALSVLVLVLGVFALACSWVPFPWVSWSLLFSCRGVPLSSMLPF